jgi:DNA-binding GntR family transcriptional regulator
VIVTDLSSIEKNYAGTPTQKSRLEFYEDILLAVINEPLTEFGLMLETRLGRGPLRQCLESLVAGGLVEPRSSHGFVLYAITEKGLVVIRVLSFQKYLEKIGSIVRTIDEALEVIPDLKR